MKVLNIKVVKLLSLCLAMVVLNSCLKDKNELNNFSGISTQPTVGIPEGGLSNFASNAIILTSSEPDTLLFHVNLASEQPFDRDVTVSIGYDEAALNAYNAGSDLQYEKFPDSIYSFTTQTVTIPAGKRMVEIPLVVFADKVNLQKSYMLPISIKDADGNTISGNFGTIYYHMIGNPLAGPYSWDWLRWNSADGSGPLSGLSFTGESAVLAPISPTQIEVASGYYIGPHYEITFDDNDGVLRNFQVAFRDDDVATMTAGGVTITDGPRLLVADPVNKRFEIQYVATTASGPRYIIDKFYK